MLAFAISGIFWIVPLYGDGLRDPRYLDGWILTTGMGIQIYFHIVMKIGRMTARSATRWRTFHISLGYLLIATFISHSDFSLPDTVFEAVLWALFVAVSGSGVFGTYLAWTIRARKRIYDNVTYERIPARCAELAQTLEATVAHVDPKATELNLPVLPYDMWIADLYRTHLRDFCRGHQNFASHLIGSQRPVKQITNEIDRLSNYVDPHGRRKLSVIRDLVVEKDRLDFARVHLGLSKAWLFVHVPATYALTILTLLHIFVVYAYSSGFW